MKNIIKTFLLLLTLLFIGCSEEKTKEVVKPSKSEERKSDLTEAVLDSIKEK